VCHPLFQGLPWIEGLLTAVIADCAIMLNCKVVTVVGVQRVVSLFTCRPRVLCYAVCACACYCIYVLISV